MACKSVSAITAALVLRNGTTGGGALSCLGERFSQSIHIQQDENQCCSDRVVVELPNKATYVTTDINAARNLLGDWKYAYQLKKWLPLSTSDVAQVEHLLHLCISNVPVPQLASVVESKLKTTANECFLVDSEAITTADIALYCALRHLPSLTAPTASWVRFAEQALNMLIIAPCESCVSSNAEHPFMKGTAAKTSEPPKPVDNSSTGINFIRQIIQADVNSGKHSTIVTRFPPEPNGFLHLGHAKSICLNFGLAKDFHGRCHLRFDDTNPTKEDMRYIDSIKEDVKWLGGDWRDHLYYASDYFQQLYEWAVSLIKMGLAYVDDQTEEEVRKNRGDVLTPGVDSPYRNRSVEENLLLFEKMRNGEIAEGKCISRAKIDMAHGNMNMRDPPLYRVRFHPHPRTGSKWCIYPIYDFAHGQSDSIEKITHSICTLEFQDHRPLYDWYQEKLGIFKTRQIEFARLNCTYVVMSKRKLVELVNEKYVRDWDDPRLPTISGMRRKGYPAEAIRDFCERIGVAKRDTTIPFDYLESCVTSALHPVALRRNVVVRPLKVIITNFPAGHVEELVCPNHPENPSQGSRTLHFGSELFIEETDFMVNPPRQFFRLFPGGEVRLRHGYWIRCHDYLCDDLGRVKEVYCTYDPGTRGGNAPPDQRKVKGTLHWVSAIDAIDVQVRLYDQLFTTPTPDSVPEGKVWQDFINPNSLEVLTAKGERSIATATHPYIKSPGAVPSYFQFERVGFFVPDYDSTPETPIMNLTVRLTDTWSAKSNTKSKEAQSKEAAKLAREKAAAERQKKKEKRLANSAKATS